MMMNNLFSIFDPSSNIYFSMNWFSLIFIMLFISNYYWLIPSKLNFLWLMLFNYINKELKISLNNYMNKFNLLLLLSLFIYIMLNNFISLFPYIFSNSSHLSFSLFLSLNLWVGFMLMGWINNTIHTLSHFTPQGTPNLLLPFMVLIESVSNLIRPMTLAVRLTANIIAGHLLMTLLSQLISIMNFNMMLLMILIQSFLVILEVAVSFIQSYVFTILCSLYAAESN
uniref:ATP synthase subunit a n=1 Tax=Tessmannella kiplingi TaxID=2943473 RepID=A0A9E8K067_9HYME|nr:ATP synthase F0 subunit 6 [Tessmannella kiplingi]